MADHERFRCRSLDDLRARVAELGLDIHFEEQIEALRQPVRIGHISSPNALAVHPMEGCDGKPDGSPSELTYRRYDRFARGGAGLIWFEATAVLREARANPRQLWIHPGNVDEFARLVSHMRKAACEEFGPRFRQVIICQLTHSGRYSRPEGSPSPVIAHHCPYLDPSTHVLPDLPVVSDDRLEQIQDAFAAAARLAHQAGFDGVDIKSCHRYLISELLASHTRQGRYGGPFENRTRFLRSVAARLHAELGASFIVACRLNVFDGIPHPYGFGQSTDGRNVPDLREPKQLVRELAQIGMPLVSVTAGNPYYNPHVNRPFDTPVANGYIPNEHPLEGVARLFHFAREIQQEVPDIVVVGAGYSWLRQYMGFAAEANLRRGWMRMAGVGRGAFAYPDFARDLLTRGKLDPERVCITCSSCTQIMRDGGTTGCVPRDRELYQPVLVEGLRRRRSQERAHIRIADHY